MIQCLVKTQTPVLIMIKLRILSFLELVLFWRRVEIDFVLGFFEQKCNFHVEKRLIEIYFE